MLDPFHTFNKDKKVKGCSTVKKFKQYPPEDHKAQPLFSKVDIDNCNTNRWEVNGLKT